MTDNHHHDIKQALLDVRKSQRLLVAFHQRILPIIESISTQLGCKFHFWQPSNHLNTPQGNANPFKRWGWDFSPLNDAAFIFLTPGCERNIARCDQWGFAVRLQTDSEISGSFQEEESNLDALNLPQPPECSETRLELIAFKPTQDLTENWAWWNIYAETDFPPQSGEIIEGYQGTKAFCFPVNIEDLFTENAAQTTVEIFKMKLVLNGFIPD